MIFPLLGGTNWDNLVLRTNYISPRPSGAPMGYVPPLVVKEFEHQARQNLCTLNFPAAFTKAASECNLAMEKNARTVSRLLSKELKAIFKRVPNLKMQLEMVMQTFVTSGAPYYLQSSDLNMLLSSFHRDCPKSSRNLPKWNISVVLNELIKAPFEPMKDQHPQRSHPQNCFLASFGLWRSPQ